MHAITSLVALTFQLPRGAISDETADVPNHTSAEHCPTSPSTIQGPKARTIRGRRSQAHAPGDERAPDTIP